MTFLTTPDGVRLRITDRGTGDRTIVLVHGWKLSHRPFEHAILRRMFRDPRLHYAINCASLGCPSLRQSAFTGADLEAQLQVSA